MEIGHTAIQNLRGEAPRQEAKRRLSNEHADLYAHLVTCCLHENDLHAAFLYAAAGKGRAFVDTLASTRFDLWAAAGDTPSLAHDLQRLRTLRQQIDTLQSQLGKQAHVVRSAATTTLRQLQHQEQTLWEDLSYVYPALTATQQAQALTIADMQRLAHELQATLVEYYLHHEGWCAFVVTADQVQYVPLPLITEELIDTLLTWVSTMDSDLRTSPLLMGKPLRDAYQAVIAPLHSYCSPGHNVVLAPHWVLNVFPFNAARHPQRGHYVGEEYLLTFTPSLSALWVMHQQHAKPAHAVEQRPPPYLCSTAYAPDMIGLGPATRQTVQLFAPHLVEQYDQSATPDAFITCVRQAPTPNMLHIAAHGWFDTELPEQSGLALYDGQLIIQRIISEMPLSHTRLVTLAACLLGRTHVEQSGEAVGITHAFLTAGAQSVVTALWSVEIDATMALFQAFYQHIITGCAPAVAMRAAIAAIRTTPGWEHPFYWGAWHVYGLAYAYVQELT